jgi:hypothetical protein
MKRLLILVPVLTGAMFLSGCVSWVLDAATGHPSWPGAGGIDPVTMAGIEASNRANDESILREQQWSTDQSNQTSQDAANAAAAEASAEAGAAAAASAAAAANP